MSLAPIVLFAYRRPNHVLRVLKALDRNELAEQSELFIYCDGPEPDASRKTIENIIKVRKTVRCKQWCKKVTIYESEFNLGLADSIVQGVTETVNKFGKVIVLEDDILTSRGFLTYMNDALDLYAQDAQVFQVSGFMVPSNIRLEPTGFFRAPASWGWATWRDAWTKYEHNIDALLLFAQSIDKHEFNLESSYDYFDQILRNRNGVINTWCVRFYTSMLMHGGLALYPRKSLVRNIGFDKDATNTKRFAKRQTKTYGSEFPSVRRIPIAENPTYYQSFIEHFRHQNYLWSKPTMPVRIKGKIRQIFGH